MPKIMPKKDASSTSKTASKRPSKLTDAEKQHQALLKGINEQTDYAAAKETWTQLADRLKALHDKKDELGDEARDADRARTRAAAAQNYLEAQTFKDKHDGVKAQIEAIRAEMTPLVELRDAAQSKHTELFLADTSAAYHQAQPVTVVMVRVIDPRSSDYDSATYLESDDTVQLNVAGQQFESEAYHVHSWATDHGFVVRRTEATVEL